MMKNNKKFNLDNVNVELFEKDIDIEEFEVSEDPVIIEKIQEYLQLDYPISLKKDKDDKGGYWIAEHPNLLGCKSHGETKEEALLNLEEMKESWMYSYAELGKEIPKPNQENEKNNCSGKILLRLPKELHFKLISKSKKEGISLNQEILYLLSSSFEKSIANDYIESINKKLEYLVGNQKEVTKGIELVSMYESINKILNNNEKKVHKTQESSFEDFFLQGSIFDENVRIEKQKIKIFNLSNEDGSYLFQ